MPLRFSERKKPTPLRVRRRRTRALFALGGLVLLAGSASAISYVSYLPRFNVSSISIVGTTNVSPNLVEVYAQTQLHDGTHPYLSPENIFLYNPDHLARAIVGFFPRIKSANVDRSSMLATAVMITIAERQPFALWCRTTDCYQMDDSGFIFAQTDGSAVSTTQYVFQGDVSAASSSSAIGQSFVPAHLPGLLVLLQSLAQAGFPPQGASVEGDQDFTVPLKDSFYIKASFGADSDTLVKNLQLILTSEALQGNLARIEYVDLRFGDKVYYKLKGGNETKAPQ